MKDATGLVGKGLHGSEGLPEREEHERKRSGFEGGEKIRCSVNILKKANVLW